MALPPEHRLRGHRAFERLYRRGRRYQGEWLMLRLMHAEPALLSREERQHGASPWRCGIVVSSKVHKRAVRRNRLRRLLQEELRSRPPQPGSPRWLLLSLRPGSAEAPEARLLGECRDLLHQAGLLP
ncbi:MAG: ribonuclease P protein component [Cyanobium sp.]